MYYTHAWPHYRPDNVRICKDFLNIISDHTTWNVNSCGWFVQTVCFTRWWRWRDGPCGTQIDIWRLLPAYGGKMGWIGASRCREKKESIAIREGVDKSKLYRTSSWMCFEYPTSYLMGIKFPMLILYQRKTKTEDVLCSFVRIDT